MASLVNVEFCLFISFLILVPTVSECHCKYIEVVGTDLEDGVYVGTDKNISSAPYYPVWKKTGGEYYVFNTGDQEGWRLGDLGGCYSYSYSCYKWNSLYKGIGRFY